MILTSLKLIPRPQKPLSVPSPPNGAFPRALLMFLRCKDKYYSDFHQWDNFVKEVSCWQHDHIKIFFCIVKHVAIVSFCAPT